MLRLRWRSSRKDRGSVIMREEDRGGERTRQEALIASRTGNPRQLITCSSMSVQRESLHCRFGSESGPALKWA
jgi:hypothetical protein